MSVMSDSSVPNTTHDSRRLRLRGILASLFFIATYTVRNNIHWVRFLALLVRPETVQDAVHEEPLLCTSSENAPYLRPVAPNGRTIPSDGRAHSHRSFRLQLLQQGSRIPARSTASVTEYLPRSPGFRS